MPVVVIVGLILAGLWLAGRSGVMLQGGQTLPAPDPIPPTAGTALLSPAMGSDSPMYQQGNQLRLQTNYQNLHIGGWAAPKSPPLIATPPPLPTPAVSGQTATAASSLPSSAAIYGTPGQFNGALLNIRKI